MKSADKHSKESLRLAALLRYEVLDSANEKDFDELTELAGIICGTPISLISLIDEDRQWFKSKVGIEAEETSRDVAFCSHAILQDQVFEVPNAKQDNRFHDNPLVTGDPNIRFYAGAPLVTNDGLPLGTLCVINQTPQSLTPSQKRALEILASQVMALLELRLHNKRLTQLASESEQLFSVIAHDLRSPFNGILGLTKLLSENGSQFSGEEIAEFSRQILTSSSQVYQLLDELLQWAQHRLTDNKITASAHALVFLINEALQTVAPQKNAKQQSIRLDIDDSGVQAYCDPVATKTVIRNLLSNAVKYSKVGGEIVVRVVVEPERVLVKVIDQGHGVPEDAQAQLFGQSVTSKIGSEGEQGFGLGLRLCKEFITHQGGDIWLEASSNQGSIFSFCLEKVT